MVLFLSFQNSDIKIISNNATHYPLNCSISDRRQNPVEFQLVTYFYVILLVLVVSSIAACFEILLKFYC